MTTAAVNQLQLLKRRSTRMALNAKVGVSGEDEFHASLSDQCLDDSERCIFAFEHRALFDMNFEIGERFAGQSSGGKRRGIEAIVVNRLPEADAVPIGTRKCVRVELSDQPEII